jgi:acetyl esterase/lipase
LTPVNIIVWNLHVVYYVLRQGFNLIIYQNNRFPVQTSVYLSNVYEELIFSEEGLITMLLLSQRIAPIFLAFYLCLSAWSQDGKELPLWPHDAPGGVTTNEPESCVNERISHVNQPSLTVFLPPEDKATGVAVVICPGGGYRYLTIEKEGGKVARWLNSFGVAGLVLKSRLPNGKHAVPLMDAQRALRLARSHAQEWNLDPHRIGIMGFSAGGHLASTAATHYDSGIASATDPVERESCRPDFTILIYPVVTMQKYAHRGSRNNLLGKSPSAELLDLYSNEKQVSDDTPPMFLVHAGDDRSVPVENSLQLYSALRRHKVPVEMHLFERGGHGFGLSWDNEPPSKWSILCQDWFSTRNLLKQQTKEE